MRSVLLLALLSIAPGLSSVCAQEKKEPAKSDAGKKNPAHEELITLRKSVVDAFNKKDIDGLLKHLHKDIIITWQNGEVSRGHEGVRKYYEKMLVGDKRIVESVQVDPKVTDWADLYAGDRVAVAFGKLNDAYTLRDGMEFNMDSLWSATLVKEDGKWLITNFHASTNAFDNDILHLAVKKTMTWAAAAGLGGGLLLGILLMFAIGKMRKPPVLK